MRTYEVLYAGAPDGPFERINERDLLTTTFLHASDTVAGYYKIRAVDYWGRGGEASETVPFPDTGKTSAS